MLKRKDGTFFDAQLESVPIQLNGQLALNSILTDITERTWIAREQKTEREQHTRLLGAEIEDLHILHEVSTKYLAGGDTQPLFQEIVEAAIAITRADKGSMQIQDPFSGKLKIIARKGFSTRFVEFFDSVGEGEAACGTAMKRKQRVIVEDVSKSSIFSEAALNVLLQEGVHAVQSTPLITRVGQLVGMISTHFDKIHPFNEREFRILDILARQAADILERNRIEEKEHCLELQLRQAQKMEALGTLTGGVAHDFNNILAAIIGFTELVADHVPKESREAHHLKRVMESSLRGRDLVRQMLTFSRKAEQEKKPLSLSSIVKETVKLIRATTPTTISIKVNALSESGLILADPTQIQQVIMNLCTNAAHAMREKGGTLDIQLSNHSVSPSNGNPDGIKPGLYTRLTVRDTGTGMSPDIMDKIFDPFFTTKKLGEGTGLGLSVVHGIVKQSNGHITVESEPGRGSIFTVYFPQIPGELEPDAVSDDALPTGSERILFVDDEEALVEMGEDILAELGYEVTSRMSGKEALALFTLDPSRFDLVITDQTMPEMTGVELAKEILALRADMPIIMCTGFSYAGRCRQGKGGRHQSLCDEAPDEEGDRKDDKKGT